MNRCTIRPPSPRARWPSWKPAPRPRRFQKEPHPCLASSASSTPGRSRPTPGVVHKGKPAVRFKGPDGKAVVAPLTKKGDRCRVPSPVWYGQYRDADGRVVRVALVANKAAAEQLLAELVRKAAQGLARMLDPHEAARKRPLAEHLAEYRRHLDAKNNDARYVGQVARALRGGLRGGGRRIHPGPHGRPFRGLARRSPARGHGRLDQQPLPDQREDLHEMAGGRRPAAVALDPLRSLNASTARRTCGGGDGRCRSMKSPGCWPRRRVVGDVPRFDGRGPVFPVRPRAADGVPGPANWPPSRRRLSTWPATCPRRPWRPRTRRTGGKPSSRCRATWRPSWGHLEGQAVARLTVAGNVAPAGLQDDRRRPGRGLCCVDRRGGRRRRGMRPAREVGLPGITAQAGMADFHATRHSYITRFAAERRPPEDGEEPGPARIDRPDHESLHPPATPRPCGRARECRPWWGRPKSSPFCATGTDGAYTPLTQIPHGECGWAMADDGEGAGKASERRGRNPLKVKAFEGGRTEAMGNDKRVGEGTRTPDIQSHSLTL